MYKLCTIYKTNIKKVEINIYFDKIFFINSNL